MSSVELSAMPFLVMICAIIPVRANAMHHADRRALQAKVQADTVDQSKSTFPASMSHEPRTLPNAILGFARHLTQAQNPVPENRTDFSFPFFINKLS